MSMAERRTNWEFSIQVVELVALVRQQVDYHQHKVDSWRRVRDQRLADLQAHGINAQQVLSVYRTRQLGQTYGGVKPVLDPEKERLLGEAEDRVVVHQAELRAYQRWLVLLEHEEDQGRELLMTYDDAHFFRLLEAAAEDEVPEALHGA